MKLKEHADNSERLIGVRGEDIHEWIDGYFDSRSHQLYMQFGYLKDYNPYAHRVHRHCQEALHDAIEEFKNIYPENIVEAVFESHIRDDYNGEFPSKNDYENDAFHERHHR